MSGGFFRGTSADQDTRFSNKQAKLMKSQKFAPELDHLVDFTKVKADVVRPWIANRVTELLGFEDEVLINFIYGLLDGKEVNGKEIQISLTGFMEKNTGKFMKELWTLLLSAQKNASGVPQQFLDAKEEETRKKKAEADWIANEIQKKKEKESREFDQEKLRKMDGVIEVKGFDASLEPLSKPMLPRDSSARPEDVKETDERNNKRGRNRVSRSPYSDEHSHSPLRGSPSRSVSKSISDSRRYSDENNRSRSVSRSHEARGRSISSERVYRSPSRRSVTPHRKHSPRGSLSPSRRRSFYSTQSRLRSHRRSPSPVRRRLRSPFRRRSPSPFRHRSPRRRSPSPVRRRSPFSLRRRSPMRRRSPSPRRRRSPNPVRRRSPSPVRRRSPSLVRRRSPSPVRRRTPSPVRRRSPSPIRQYRRSPLTPHRRSLSPMRYRSTVSGRGRSPIPPRRRSPSPYGSSSPSPIRRRSPSPVKRRSPKNQRRSPVRSPRERIRAHDKSPPVARRLPSSLRSPQRDPEDQRNSRNKVSSLSPSPERSPVLSVSPPDTKKRGASEDRRSTSPYENPVRQIRGQITYDGSSNPPQKLREQKPRRNSPETSEEEEEINYAREDVDYKSMSAQKRSTHSSTVSMRKSSTEKVHYKEDYSPERLAGRLSTESQSHLDKMEFKKDQELKSEKSSGRRAHNEIPDKQKPSTYPGEAQKSDERKYPSNNVKDSDRRNKSEKVAKLVEKVDKNNRVGTFDTGSEESDKPRSAGKEKRKHKRSERKEVASDDDYSYESEVEGRKGSKRRRKDEKKLRKEEKRRRREERRRRREERRAEKLKAKTLGSVTPEREKSPNDVYASDGEHVARRESRPSDNEEAESEQKKLEIELRKKALESLKAKKGIGH